MGTIAFTFDDGPDPVWTPRLLDLLTELDARATFFPIADRAVANPELLARMRDAGHTVGLHCDAHVRHTDRDHDWLRRDTACALDKLRGVGVRPTLWRTPWGATAPWSAPMADEHGLRLVGWTVDSHDWRGDSAERMLAATGEAIVDGAVVLAHDGIGPGAQRDGAEQTLRYTALTAAQARHQGLQLEALA